MLSGLNQHCSCDSCKGFLAALPALPSKCPLSEVTMVDIASWLLAGYEGIGIFFDKIKNGGGFVSANLTCFVDEFRKVIEIEKSISTSFQSECLDMGKPVKPPIDAWQEQFSDSVKFDSKNNAVIRVNCPNTKQLVLTTFYRGNSTPWQRNNFIDKARDIESVCPEKFSGTLLMLVCLASTLSESLKDLSHVTLTAKVWRKVYEGHYAQIYAVVDLFRKSLRAYPRHSNKNGVPCNGSFVEYFYEFLNRWYCSITPAKEYVLFHHSLAELPTASTSLDGSGRSSPHSLVTNDSSGNVTISNTDSPLRSAYSTESVNTMGSASTTKITVNANTIHVTDAETFAKAQEISLPATAREKELMGSIAPFNTLLANQEFLQDEDNKAAYDSYQDCITQLMSGGFRDDQSFSKCYETLSKLSKTTEPDNTFWPVLLKTLLATKYVSDYITRFENTVEQSIAEINPNAELYSVTLLSTEYSSLVAKNVAVRKQSPQQIDYLIKRLCAIQGNQLATWDAEIIAARASQEVTKEMKECANELARDIKTSQMLEQAKAQEKARGWFSKDTAKIQRMEAEQKASQAHYVDTKKAYDQLKVSSARYATLAQANSEADTPSVRYGITQDWKVIDQREAFDERWYAVMEYLKDKRRMAQSSYAPKRIQLMPNQVTDILKAVPETERYKRIRAAYVAALQELAQGISNHLGHLSDKEKKLWLYNPLLLSLKNRYGFTF